MITLITGDNTFEIERAVNLIAAGFEGLPERVDGSILELKQLPDLLMGATLFADKRLVIIKNLSENQDVWPSFGNWLARVSDDIEVILIDTKPDKRTVTYKALKKQVKVVEFNQWSDHDWPKAEQWLAAEAKSLGVSLDTKCTHDLVRLVGLDQWQLFHALEKLSLVEAVTPEVIAATIDANPVENVFVLFEAALSGNVRLVADMVWTLELSQDPYRTFGLLSGQAFQLAALVAADPSDNVARDFGLNPYGVSKLKAAAKRQGSSGAKKIIRAFAEADDDMKLSRAEPWLLVERALMKVAAG